MSSDNATPTRRPGTGSLWRRSLLVRRVTAGSVFALAAAAVYLGSHIPRAVSLPLGELNEKAAARLGDEQIVIEKPEIGAGELAISYQGSRNEVADLWVENATLAPESQKMFLPGASQQSPARIGYTTTGLMIPQGAADTCHSVIEVRRSVDSGPLDALKLFQTDDTAGAQRFRQVVVDAGAATLDLLVHTDSPADGNAEFAGCRKLLTVGGLTPIELPLVPVHMVVHGGKIDLHFNPANPAVPIWTGPDQTFEAVSLGDKAIQGNSMRVVTASRKAVPQFDVRSAGKGGKITVGGLKVGSNVLRVEIGRDTERALAYANGGSIYNYDLVEAVQKNLILSSALAAVLIPALLAWVKKNCFPSAKKDEEDSKQEQ